MSFELARLAARVPILRAVLGLPVRLAQRDDRTLEAREASVAAVRGSRVGRLAERMGGRGDPGPKPSQRADRPAGFPRVGPELMVRSRPRSSFLRSVPFEELQHRGWHLQPNHWGSPLNDVPFLREHPELWIRSEVPRGIDWELDGQVRLLAELEPHFAELGDVPDDPAEPGRFAWENDAFPAGDALAYYGIVRRLEPRRVVEVGAGWSSLVLGRAVAANERPCEVTLIDPEPRWAVLGELPPAWSFVESPVQFTDLGIFESLEAGDVLFYDGSHCVRTAGDVNWIFFEVLPRLAPGVWIHVHDLGWPWDYPAQWVLDDGLSWNEEYFVQAFLMGNADYRVRLAVSMLASLRRDAVEDLRPEFSGGSLWIEKVGGRSAPDPTEGSTESSA